MASTSPSVLGQFGYPRLSGTLLTPRLFQDSQDCRIDSTTVPGQSASTFPDCPSTVGPALDSLGLFEFPGLSRTLGAHTDQQPDCSRTVRNPCGRLSWDTRELSRCPTLQDTRDTAESPDSPGETPKRKSLSDTRETRHPILLDTRGRSRQCQHSRDHPDCPRTVGVTD